MNVESVVAEPEYRNSTINKLDSLDREFHDWYRFVLSYPPHLVRKYIEEFRLGKNDLLLDPFCGTGTTILEAKLNGVPSIGIEANTFAHFASATKTDWTIDPSKLILAANKIRKCVNAKLAAQSIDKDSWFGLRTLNEEQEKLILKNSISSLPLHKALVLLDEIDTYKNKKTHKYLALAFANAVVYQISNLKFGPEVGVGKIKIDVDVVSLWYNQIHKIYKDLSLNRENETFADVIHSDSRNLKQILSGKKISAIITSPPYPNEKDYTRTTRLESVLLGFIKNREDLRLLKRSLLRSNTKGVYKGDNDDEFVKDFVEIQEIANEIERRRIELGKTSGFEKLYAKVTKLYFGGMAKHLEELKPMLLPNAQLAYVVGDQASFLRVMIPTGKILGQIAESLGYELVRIDLFRTRFSTATKSDLNEEVVILRWKG